MLDDRFKMMCDVVATAIVKDFLKTIQPFVNEWVDGYEFEEQEMDNCIKEYSDLIYKQLKEND